MWKYIKKVKLTNFYFAFVIGYFLYLLLMLPMMYLIPFLYQVFGLASPGCGDLIRNGTQMPSSSCANVEFNLHASTAGLIAVIVSFINLGGEKEK